MKKNISHNILTAALLIAAVSTCHLSWGYDVALRNDVPSNIAQGVNVTVHNASAFCKNIRRNLGPEETYKEKNGACMVTKVTAELKDVSLISMVDNQTQQSTNGLNQHMTLNSYTTNQKQTTGQPTLQKQGLVKKIVMAQEYKGPRTGTTTDTYVIREKRDSNGNPIPLFNKNNKGELVTLSGMIIRDQTNSPITEKDGLFFKGAVDITSQISTDTKRNIVATPTFEVIREQL